VGGEVAKGVEKAGRSMNNSQVEVNRVKRKGGPAARCDQWADNRPALEKQLVWMYAPFAKPSPLKKKSIKKTNGKGGEG